ncbi:hypothetical protein AVEN_103000-1 [Araneus ventricosus]|uniref:Uncharacterized protein n=1 Tax=Araneus ventricosus TaxID=182803 RepID=A0A4Y2B8E5_ARAVE|nr:hypothetical protein AVEN_103000-1 [Araneus ventricosus]
MLASFVETLRGPQNLFDIHHNARLVRRDTEGPKNLFDIHHNARLVRRDTEGPQNLFDIHHNAKPTANLRHLSHREYHFNSPSLTLQDLVDHLDHVTGHLEEDSPINVRRLLDAALDWPKIMESKVS